jgi:hypothetical protein
VKKKQRENKKREKDYEGLAVNVLTSEIENGRSALVADLEVN